MKRIARASAVLAILVGVADGAWAQPGDPAAPGTPETGATETGATETGAPETGAPETGAPEPEVQPAAPAASAPSTPEGAPPAAPGSPPPAAPAPAAPAPAAPAPGTAASPTHQGAPPPYAPYPPYPSYPQYAPYPAPYPHYWPARPPSPPRILPYEEGVAPPTGYVLRERAQRGLVIAGSVTLGSTWLLSAVTAGMIASNSSNDDFVPLFVPVVGPFIAMGTTDASGLGSFLLVVDGLAQVTSLGMLVAGIIYPKHEWVLPYARLELAPLVSTEAALLGARGSF